LFDDSNTGSPSRIAQRSAVAAFGGDHLPIPPPHPPPRRRLFLQRESLAALDAVQGFQRLAELPVQAGRAAAAVLAG
jgi:hypothetical protein